MDHVVHQPPRRLTRRQFLAIGWTVAGLIAAGEAAAAVGLYLQPKLREVFGGQITLGPVTELKRRMPVGGVPIYFPNARMYISRTPDGFLALSQQCTHLKYPIAWMESEDQFHCPSHGALYDRAGECRGGPCPRPLDTFPLRVANGELIVDTSRVIQRQWYAPSQALQV